LIYASGEGHIELSEFLIAKGADLNVKAGYPETSPLHGAASENHKEIAALLIIKGADVNLKNDDGETPLDWAEEEKNTDLAELLRKHGGKTGAELEAEGK
jgi:ankyrin repeat protein